MFLKLPYEIMLGIFNYLEFEDKLNLKTTCTKLNYLITRDVLYEELNLLDSLYGITLCADEDDDDRYSSGTYIVQKLINDQFDGSSVRILYLNITRLHNTTLSELSNLFPNVSRVIISKDRKKERHFPYKYLSRSLNVTHSLVKWRSTIKKIDTCYDWCDLATDVFHSKYPQLKELDLNHVSGVLMKCVGNHRLPFFANAPSLTSLTLRDASINLEILEAIHAGFPLLTSLRLFNPCFEIKENAALPQSIQPASAVSCLGLFNMQDIYKDAVVLDYILHKYINVQQLVYSIHWSRDYYLKTYDEFEITQEEYECSDSNSDYEDAVSSEITSSESTFPIYSALEFNFFSSLQKSIKHLTLKINNKTNAVAALAKTNPAITTLQLLDHSPSACSSIVFMWKPNAIVDSSILKHLQKFKSLNTLKMALNSSVQAANLKYISFSVTRLSLSIRGEPFYVGWVLSMFPSIEELYIISSERDIKNLLQCQIRGIHDDGDGATDNNESGVDDDDLDIGKTEPINEHPKLRTLTIRECPINLGFYDFIKTTAPNLEWLDLDISLPLSTKTSAYKLDLSNWYLKKCSLAFGCLWTTANIYCIIKIGDVTKHFEIDSLNETLIPANYRYKKDRDRVIVEVISDCNTDIKIFRFPIVKIGDNIVVGL